MRSLKTRLSRRRLTTGSEVTIVISKPAARAESPILVEALQRAGWKAFIVGRHGRQARAVGVDAAAYVPGPRARALLRGREIANADLRVAGGAFDADQVRSLLADTDGRVLDEQVRQGHLLTVPGPDSRARFPAVQFTTDGVLPGLKEVQNALPTRDPWAVLNFFVHPDDRLEGCSPIDALRRGEVARVVSAARALGMQGG